MATIEITLSENDIRAACKAWAVTRILNEGRAVRALLSEAVSADGSGSREVQVVVHVETDRMSQPHPHYIQEADDKKER